MRWWAKHLINLECAIEYYFLFIDVRFLNPIYQIL